MMKVPWPDCLDPESQWQDQQRRVKHPARQLEVVQHHVRHLQQQPRTDHVGDTHANDVAVF